AWSESGVQAPPYRLALGASDHRVGEKLVIVWRQRIERIGFSGGGLRYDHAGVKMTTGGSKLGIQKISGIFGLMAACRAVSASANNSCINVSMSSAQHLTRLESPVAELDQLCRGFWRIGFGCFEQTVQRHFVLEQLIGKMIVLARVSATDAILPIGAVFPRTAIDD